MTTTTQQSDSSYQEREELRRELLTLRSPTTGDYAITSLYSPEGLYMIIDFILARTQADQERAVTDQDVADRIFTKLGVLRDSMTTVEVKAVQDFARRISTHMKKEEL